MRYPILFITVLALTTAAWPHPACARNAKRDTPPRIDAHHRPDQPATDAQLEQVMLVIKDVNPRWHQRIANSREDNPQRTRQFLSRVYSSPPMQEMLRARESDPNLYRMLVADRRLRIQNATLAAQVRKAREQGNTDLAEQRTAQLRSNLEQHLDLRRQLHRQRITDMQEKLAEHRAELDAHAQRKQQIVDEQLQRLLSGQHPRHLDHPPRDTMRQRWQERRDRNADSDRPRPHARPPARDRDADSSSNQSDPPVQRITPRHD